MLRRPANCSRCRQWFVLEETGPNWVARCPVASRDERESQRAIIMSKWLADHCSTFNIKKPLVQQHRDKRMSNTWYNNSRL
jgi:hypothetical protein